MKLLVRDFLMTHSFADLEREHGICARPNRSFDKWSLNYDSILTKPGDRVADQCRGLVIRPWDYKSLLKETGVVDVNKIVGGLDVLAWPMNRFYNAGDPAGANINWTDNDIIVLEKLDGTCCIVYWDALHGKWHCATRSVPEADLPIEYDHDFNLVDIGEITFSSLFQKAAAHTTSLPFDEWADKLRRECTYVFELTTPWNKVVIEHAEPKITLLAVRVTAPGVEVDPVPIASDLGVNVPARFSLPTSVDELLAFVCCNDPSKFEGVVAVNSKFERLKIKHPGYTLASRMTDALTVSRYAVLKLILQDKADDIAATLTGSVLERMQAMIDGVRDYVKRIDAQFEEIKIRCETRKDFAFEVKKLNDFQAVYFGLWEKRAPNAAAWFREQANSDRITRGSLDYILGKMTV